mmetsp:Transcript_33808/g.77172  ORF Transcript_33808/g.77172 Transcript_33808/m.77172 type:complete len:766 (-) Transcript_33808:149-2446(-)
MRQQWLGFLLLAISSLASANLEGVCDEDAQVELLQTDINIRKAFDADIKAHQVATSTTTEVENTTTLDPTGLTTNAEGDLDIFLNGIMMYGGAAIFFIVAFTFIWQWFPMPYFHNALEDSSPLNKKVGKIGEGGRMQWIYASLSITVDEVTETAGLDAAMVLEFTHMAMKILVVAGFPIFCVTGPLNLAFGGHEAGKDRLSYFSYGNVAIDSWLYKYISPLVTWYVCIVVQYFVWESMRSFITRRYHWIRHMDDKRACTVLVEGIPDSYQNEDKLKELFNSFSGGQNWVSDVNTVKDTTTLDALVANLQYHEKQVIKLQTQWEQDGKHPDKRPMIKISYFGGDPTDGLDYHSKEVANLKKALLEAQTNLLQQAKASTGGVNLGNAFITFKDRVSTELALRTSGDISPDASEWQISRPPAPKDIQWSDLMQDPNAETVRTVLGWTLTSALIFAYLPCVIGIQNLANNIDMGPAQALWELVAPTMGTMFMVAMLPTFLLLIFKMCFTLVGVAVAQLKLQRWYFWFQMLFLVFIAAVGRDFMAFAKMLATPTDLIRELADTLPTSTHFFMNYFTLAYMTKAMVLFRHTPLMKYLAASKIWPPEEAKKVAEPEDQDYYGLGGRMARFTIFLAIGIIYGTMSPPICIIAFILFAEIRLSYGWLLPFAETKKPSLGGEFFVTALYHVQIANIIYGFVMAGILLRRSETNWPCYITLVAPIFVILSLMKFVGKFQWYSMPMERIIAEEQKSVKSRVLTGDYRQPSLSEALTR